MAQYTTIAETQNFIVLDRYTKHAELHDTPSGYQTETELEAEFIADLRQQGYEYLPDLRPPEALRRIRPARPRAPPLTRNPARRQPWIPPST